MYWISWSLMIGCAGKTFGSGDPTDLNTDLDDTQIHQSCLEDDGLIVATPDEEGYAQYLVQGFSRYTSIVAPNGGVIPLFAQDQVTDAQLIRARNILRFYLTDVPNSTWGSDKSVVANFMVDNHAALMMPNGTHEEGNEPRLNAQSLYENETPVEGHAWFMNSDYEHRDAAFEEIFHLLHDTGIGTYVQGAYPEYQSELKQEAITSIEDGRWGIPVDDGVIDWLDELEHEDSLAQEYIASVIDSYYGLWGAFTEVPGGMWGIYIAKTRAEVQEFDSVGERLLLDFLPPLIHTEFRLHPDLDTDFHMSFDEALPYTHRSQYFTTLTLTGDRPIGLFGNDENNTLRGNIANNILDGVSGDNTAIYCHNQEEYTIEGEPDLFTISGVEGTDELHNIQWVHFANGKVSTRLLFE